MYFKDKDGYVDLNFDLIFLSLTIMPAYRIYGFSVLTFEDKAGQSPSLFLISYLDGQTFIDILWLREPIKWLISKVMNFLPPKRPIRTDLLDLDEEGKVKCYK
jgi:hypothetical protein